MYVINMHAFCKDGTVLWYSSYCNLCTVANNIMLGLGNTLRCNAVCLPRLVSHCHTAP
jgi:hypothetical protein